MAKKPEIETTAPVPEKEVKTAAPAAEPVKKTAEKKTAAKKTAEKKTAEKKTAEKKPAAEKKTAAKSAAEKKPAAKKAPAKRAPKKTTPDIAELADMLAKKVAGKDVSKIDEDVIALEIKVYGDYEDYLYIEIKDGNVSVAPYSYIGRDIHADMPIADVITLATGKYDFIANALTGNFYAEGKLTKLLKLIKALFE